MESTWINVKMGILASVKTQGIHRKQFCLIAHSDFKKKPCHETPPTIIIAWT